jgi:hypothetical protein
MVNFLQLTAPHFPVVAIQTQDLSEVANHVVVATKVDFILENENLVCRGVNDVEKPLVEHAFN